MTPNSKLYESRIDTGLTLTTFTYKSVLALPQVKNYSASFQKDFSALNSAMGGWMTENSNLLSVFASYIKYNYYRVKYMYDNNSDSVRNYGNSQASVRNPWDDEKFDFMRGGDYSSKLPMLKEAIQELRNAKGGVQGTVQFQDVDKYIKDNSTLRIYIETNQYANGFASPLINMVYNVILSSNFPAHPFIELVRTIPKSNTYTRGWGLIDTVSKVGNPSSGSIYKYGDMFATNKDKFNNLTATVAEFNKSVFNVNQVANIVGDRYDVQLNSFLYAIYTLVGTYGVLDIIMTDKYVTNGGTLEELSKVVSVSPIAGKVGSSTIKSDKVIAAAKTSLPKVAKVGGTKESVPESSIKGILGGDMGTLDLVEGRTRSQEIANMQVNLVIGLTALSHKSIENFLATEKDPRVKEAVEAFGDLYILDFKKGDKINIKSKLNDGIFGFRTKKMVLEFKRIVNLSPKVPVELDLKNPESPVVDTACKTAINYVLDNILFPLSTKVAAMKSTDGTKITPSSPKEEEFMAGLKAKQDTTISDIGKNLDRTAVTGGTEDQ